MGDRSRFFHNLDDKLTACRTSALQRDEFFQSNEWEMPIDLTEKYG